MIFSSQIFLFLFLPLVLSLYLGLVVWRAVAPGTSVSLLGNGVLLLASLVFYAWGETWFVAVMVGSILLDYTCGRLIARGWQRQDAGLRKLGLVLSVAGNLGILCIWKYFDFFTSSLDRLCRLAGAPILEPDLLGLALPMGISFFTLQSMSYTIDVYRNRVQATRNILHFATYVSLFPQLAAGPIVRYRDIEHQLTDRKVDLDGLAVGIGRFIVGLGKKVLIADSVGVVADQVWALDRGDLSAGLAWTGALCFTLQIYFDFSGYSDMAIGLGRMFGFRFRENFDYPYIAASIGEFWRRWHISLSTWFRDYLYVPLGGNRKGAGRTYVNLVVVFLLCGLWHGASWLFVAWGLYHGLFLVLERIGLKRLLARLPLPLRLIYTVLVIVVGWVLFRSASLERAGSMLQAMLGFADGSATAAELGIRIGKLTWIAMLAGVVGSAPVGPWSKGLAASLLARLREARSRLGSAALGPGLRLATVAVLMLTMLVCAMSLAASTHQPFIYFRF